MGHAVGPCQLFYCTNHIIQNVKMWCRKHRFPKKETNLYVSQVQNLIGTNSIELFEHSLDKLSLNWDSRFTNYFQSSIKPPLFDNLTKSTETQFAHFKSKAITSNLSESWHNKLQKHFTKSEREHMRVDHLVANLFTIQTSFLDEYNRAIQDEGGRYTLKEEVRKSALKLDLKHANLKIMNILREVKEEVKSMPKKDQVDGSGNSMELDLAELAQQLNLVQYIGPFKCFIVAHPYNITDLTPVYAKDGKNLFTV